MREFYDYVENTYRNSTEFAYRMQEQLERFAEPIRRLQAQIDILNQPARRMQEQFDRFSESMRMKQEYYDQFTTSALVREQQFDRLTHGLAESIRLKQEYFDRLTASALVREQQFHVAESVRLKQEYFDQITRSIYRMESDSIAASHHYLNQVYKTISINELESLHISNDGSATINGEFISDSEFNDVFENFICILPDKLTLAQLLESICKYLKKLKKPLSALFLIIILPYLNNLSANLTTPYIQSVIESSFTKPKSYKIKAIKNGTTLNHELELLKNYRFVSALTLSVRKYGSKKSEKIGDIHSGQVVKIVSKGRRWAYIEFIDINDKTQFGWVYNRYLSKFKN